MCRRAARACRQSPRLASGCDACPRSGLVLVWVCGTVSQASPAPTGGRQSVEDGGQALAVGERAVALDDRRGVVGMAGLEQSVQPAKPVRSHEK